MGAGNLEDFVTPSLPESFTHLLANRLLLKSQFKSGILPFCQVHSYSKQISEVWDYTLQKDPVVLLCCLHRQVYKSWWFWKLQRRRRHGPFSARGQDTYRVDYAHSEGQAALGRDPREYLVQTKSFRASAKDSSGHGQREVSAIFILADLDILQIPRLKIWHFALQLKALAAPGPIEGWCCRGSQADSCWQGRQWGPFWLDSCPWVAGWDVRLLQTPVVWNEVWQLL